MSRQIFNKTITVDGVDIFYREAGDRKNPSLLLLHGFPTSSVMFKNLMVTLADKFHLIAPDYPGFGFSAFPDKNNLEYSFKNVSAYVNRFTEEIDVKSFTIYLHEYHCANGVRICVNHPEKIEGIIGQNGNADLQGIEPVWDEIRDYWEHPTEEKKKKVYAFLSEEGTKSQYYAGLPEEFFTHVSPETWILDWERMSRPGNLEMQFEMNCTYKSNIKCFRPFRNISAHINLRLLLYGESMNLITA